MFKLKGLYEWKLTDADTSEVVQQGSQWNVISDKFLNFLFSGTYNNSSSAYGSGMAIQLSDSTTVPGTDYRVAGNSNYFNILDTGTSGLYSVDFSAKYKACDNNFAPPGSPRTIRIIGIKIYAGQYDYYVQPNFVSFIELSTPITQNTNQYLYVRYSVYVSYSPGLGYNTPNNRFTESILNQILFTLNGIKLGNTESSQYCTRFGVTSYLPPSDINKVQRAVSVRFLSAYTDIQYSYGTPYGTIYTKNFAVGDLVGPIGTIVFSQKYMDTSPIYSYLCATLGYSQTKTLVPSISRVFPHPANRDGAIFSDPAYPSASVGSIVITGTPTNKYPLIGRIRITKSGDASDLVDEVVSYTAVDTGADSITVTQNIATGDKYRFTTTGTLPDPLVAGTDYYIINISPTVVKVATTYAFAIAGTAIDLTTQGTGDHTLIRQNTGEYKLNLNSWYDVVSISSTGVAPWTYMSHYLNQLPMAIDYDGYVMPPDLDSVYNNANNYAEGDYIAITTNPYLVPTFTASMVRGAIQNGEYIYTVQQSRKGLINNVCRWLFNTIETSQPLCKFGTGSTVVSTLLNAGTVMYICTNEGIYQYTFATPTVAPVLLTITGMINNNITDACLDPVTGYVWTGHTTGLSRINMGTLTATQYLTGSGQALEGMTANEVYVTAGQLDAYNGRVLKGGDSDINTTNYNVAWVMDDGIGYYRVVGTTTCETCCLRKGTTQVVWVTTQSARLYTVLVTGKNLGSSTQVESFSMTDAALQSVRSMYAGVGQVSSDTFVWVHSVYYGPVTPNAQVSVETYKIGTYVARYRMDSDNTPAPYTSSNSNSFGWAMGAIKRSVIDLGGDKTYAFLWHNYLIHPAFGHISTYGWDGSAWVLDNPNSRPIPKTSTHTLVNGLSVDFNNGSGSWDQQFIAGECFNFVYGPYPIKDNLQTLSVSARNYYCEAHVVESYAVTVPSTAPYEITIPEASDPNFRDLDATDMVTEVFEGATQYTSYYPGLAAYTINATTDILTVNANIPTGTAISIYSATSAANTPEPLKSNRLYYAINVNTTTIRVAESYALAMAGTYINIITAPSSNNYYSVINPTTGTFRMCGRGIFRFSSADAGKNLTLTYTYTKFTT